MQRIVFAAFAAVSSLFVAGQAQADPAHSLIACDYHADGGPTVSVADVAYGGAPGGLEAEDLLGLPCAEAQAKLKTYGWDYQRKAPISSCRESHGVNCGPPLVIIAEDVEGEALAKGNAATVDIPDCIIWIIEGANVSCSAACDPFDPTGAKIVSVDVAPGTPGDPVPPLFDDAVGMCCAEFAAALALLGGAISDSEVLPDPRYPWRRAMQENGRKIWPFTPLPDHLLMEFSQNGG